METAQSIRARRTLKVLADPSQPFAVNDAGMAPVLGEILETAGYAPFHFRAADEHRAGALSSAVPWRCHVLLSSTCRKVIDWADRERLTVGKMNHMLAAADACIVVTWLPDPPRDDAVEPAFQGFEPTLRNMEHIAAASAAVQNLLLLATDHGHSSYWSSGGMLRSEPAYDLLGIGRREVLLGAIFLFPSEIGAADSKPGKWREDRGSLDTWCRTVEL